MILMLAIILMMAARSLSKLSADQLRTRPIISRRRRLPLFAVAIALALVSLPTGAWAHAAGSEAAPVDLSSPSSAVAEPAQATTAIRPAVGRTTQANEYAAREASAKSLENFKGGDTTVVIGGSALVIIVVVILILILI